MGWRARNFSRGANTAYHALMIDDNVGFRGAGCILHATCRLGNRIRQLTLASYSCVKALYPTDRVSLTASSWDGVFHDTPNVKFFSVKLIPAAIVWASARWHASLPSRFLFLPFATSSARVIGDSDPVVKRNETKLLINSRTFMIRNTPMSKSAIISLLAPEYALLPRYNARAPSKFHVMFAQFSINIRLKHTREVYTELLDLDRVFDSTRNFAYISTSHFDAINMVRRILRATSRAERRKHQIHHACYNFLYIKPKLYFRSNVHVEPKSNRPKCSGIAKFLRRGRSCLKILRSICIAIRENSTGSRCNVRRKIKYLVL